MGQRFALQLMPVDQIIKEWRPGSHEWTWADEAADLAGSPVTDAVRQRIDRDGFDFHDDIAPVLLGSDGRVWDGHHRICIAVERGIDFLMVEVA